MKKLKISFVILYIVINVSYAQNNVINYQWKTAKEFIRQGGLPDPFLKPDGSRIKSHEEWPEQRKYIIAMLEHYQYGTMPLTPKDAVIKETLSEDIYNGTATRKLYTLTIKRNGKSLDFHFGLIKPKGNGPFPVIINNNPDLNDIIVNRARFIPEEAELELIKRGYIYCAYDTRDLSSDVNGKLDENRNNGVFLLYPEYNWGTIAAWAWGYKLIIDYFEKLDFVDIGKIVVTGHSRGGKTAFCGGIFDERIAITAPSSSGLGGTSSHLYYELTGQPEQHIGDHIIEFPHWWTGEYYKLAGFESRVPFDAHFGKIVIAPRAFFNVHAYQDYWANPFGAWLTFEAAKKVYKWLGVENNIAMHFRTGEHAQNIIDWFAILDFSDKYFYNKPPSSKYDVNYDFNQINPYPSVRIPVKWEVPGM
ncbi:MAG: hypothetical protein NT144_14615 [Bacteroidia bacterium]|nr:hypothetical protein [Bacteroidia bacterium]